MQKKNIFLIFPLVLLVLIGSSACSLAESNSAAEKNTSSTESSFNVNGYLIEASPIPPLTDAGQQQLLFILGEDQSITRPTAQSPNPPSDQMPIPITGDEESLKEGEYKIFETSLLELINAERNDQGLPPLSMNIHLVAAARDHSADMAFKNYFSHHGLDGTSFDDRVSAQGYVFSVVGETIYAGKDKYNCPEEAFHAWMNSTPHRTILLSDLVTEVGIGYTYNPDSSYGGYFTADFASPQP